MAKKKKDQGVRVIADGAPLSGPHGLRKVPASEVTAEVTKEVSEEFTKKSRLQTPTVGTAPPVEEKSEPKPQPTLRVNLVPTRSLAEHLVHGILARATLAGSAKTNDAWNETVAWVEGELEKD